MGAFVSNIGYGHGEAWSNRPLDAQIPGIDCREMKRVRPSLGLHRVTLRRQQAVLVATYTPGYSKVKRVEAQIAEITATLEGERKSILERIRHEFDEAARRESLLALAYSTQAGLVTADGEKSIQYYILKREVDSNRQLYDGMLQKVKETSIASAMRASNARVVDPAKPPASPYKPKLSTNAAIGLLAGLFLGVVFVVMREREDRTVQEPGEAPFWLSVPELGVIPSALSGRSLKKSYYYGRKALHAAKPEPTARPDNESPKRKGLRRSSAQRWNSSNSTAMSISKSAPRTPSNWRASCGAPGRASCWRRAWRKTSTPITRSSAD